MQANVHIQTRLAQVFFLLFDISEDVHTRNPRGGNTIVGERLRAGYFVCIRSSGSVSCSPVLEREACYSRVAFQYTCSTHRCPRFQFAIHFHPFVMHSEQVVKFNYRDLFHASLSMRMPPQCFQENIMRWVRSAGCARNGGTQYTGSNCRAVFKPTLPGWH